MALGIGGGAAIGGATGAVVGGATGAGTGAVMDHNSEKAAETPE